jgi:hypothetical protein
MANAVSAIIEQARRARAQLTRIRQESKMSQQKAFEGGAQLAGGAAGGFLDARLGEGQTHELFGVPTALGAGLLVGLAGMADLFPGSIYMANFGLGAASYGLGNLVREKSGQ